MHTPTHKEKQRREKETHHVIGYVFNLNQTSLAAGLNTRITVVTARRHINNKVTPQYQPRHRCVSLPAASSNSCVVVSPLEEVADAVNRTVGGSRVPGDSAMNTDSSTTENGNAGSGSETVVDGATAYCTVSAMV